MRIKIVATAYIDPTESVLIDQIKGLLVANKDKFLRVNERETSFIIVEKCYHDQEPPLSCTKVFEWVKL